MDQRSVMLAPNCRNRFHQAIANVELDKPYTKAKTANTNHSTALKRVISISEPYVRRRRMTKTVPAIANALPIQCKACLTSRRIVTISTSRPAQQHCPGQWTSNLNNFEIFRNHTYKTALAPVLNMPRGIAKTHEVFSTRQV